MKLDTALEEMEVVLNELNEQFETLKKNELRVPQIELDIIMATMRRLYESMDRLNKQKSFDRVEEPEKTGAEIELEMIAVEGGSEELETKETVKEENIIEKKNVDYEKVTSDSQEKTDTLEESENTEQEDVFADQKAESQELAEPESSLLLQFEDEVFSINESVAQKEQDKSVVNKLSNQRIENLKSAIGINDKFYFINELFSGNSQAYEDVIYTLNNFKRFEEAMQYTSTLKHKYEWSTESEAHQKLIRFLERKFAEVHA